MPWLKNADNKPKRILLYALTVKCPTGKAPSIAIAEHITSDHNVFSIRNLFSKLREIEYQIYQQNVFPKLVITDNSKAIIQAVLNELNRETLEEYLKRIYGIIFEDQKTENTQKNQTRLCSYHTLRNNYAKLKELTKDKSQMNFVQRILSRLICCKSYAEAETIILNAAIVMTTLKTDYDLKKAIKNIDQTVNTFDLPKEEDLPLLNPDIEFDDRIQIYESDGWTHHFDKLLSTTTTSLENLSDKESITNKCYIPRYYQVFLKMLPTIALRSKILPLPDSKSEDSFLQRDIPQTNCHAELFFSTKKLDKSELKATIMQYIRRSYE